MHTIQLAQLSYLLIPSMLVVVLMWYWSSDAVTPVTALARMILQLCIVGYFLTYLFKSTYFPLILLVLGVMLLISSWIALRPIANKRTELYGKALLSTTIVNCSLLMLVTMLVLKAQPWYSPAIVIPLAGMLFATGMNSISLFAERYYSELTNANIKNEAAIGVTACKTAYFATMIPTINSLLAVGLVSLPGMMTGQILSGVSPLIAVRYQIMVMLMLFCSAGLTSALFYYLVARED